MKILSICSGGLDSVAFTSMYKKDDLTVMFFDYGQKGIKEEETVRKFTQKVNCKLIKVDISFMKNLYGSSNQLTSDIVPIEKGYHSSIVVPLRNAIFLQIAMAYAYAHNFDKIILGSHLNDVSLDEKGKRLYPDCSPEFFKSFELASSLGTREDKKVKIETPSILGMTKKDLIEIGYKNLGTFIFETWSCYKSGKLQCGECESCLNRKKAFKEINLKDLTVYEKSGD